MVPTGAGVPRSAAEPGRRLSPAQLWWAMGVATTLFVAVLVVSLVVKVPYYALSPGQARDVPSLMTIEGTETADAGEILFLTINLEETSILSALAGWLDRDTQIVSAEAILGGGTEEENDAANERAMADSKDFAQIVALTELGYELETSATGARIVDITPGTPAEGFLEVGDTIVAVDGRPVSFPDDLQRLITDQPPGTVVTITVDGVADDGSIVPRQGEVTLARCGDVPVCAEIRPDEPDSSFLGVATEARDFRAELPFDITIETRNVGGPSAGLAFTLSILDLLTPGDLTGGRRIAVTGTIRLDGTVGDVGGVVQKAAAARAAGAEVMLVPAGEYDEVAGRAGMEVIPVSSLDEALDALEALGGDPLPGRRE